MSIAIRAESQLPEGPLRKDIYIFNNISKLRIETADDQLIDARQVRVFPTNGAIQRFKASLTHNGKLVACYTREGIEYFQQINLADEYILYSPSNVVDDVENSPLGWILQETSRYIAPNGQIQPMDRAKAGFPNGYGNFAGYSNGGMPNANASFRNAGNANGAFPNSNTQYGNRRWMPNNSQQF